jgi:pyruvate-formate lyase-activating enzyme
MNEELNPRDFYRLPWSLNDNVLSWLEPTKRCNLYCEGCYSRNEKSRDKSLAQIRADLDVFVNNRRFDSVSITGGDPLMHPEIVEIVRIIRQEYDKKPVLNTNGLALTPELTRDLKRAGLFGFTFHVDSGQTRPGWKGKSEVELNPLRLQLAQMAADVGDLSVAFNSTVYPHTLDQVPAILEWAREHIDLVHSIVLILFRTSQTKHFEYYAQGKRVDGSELVYYDEDKLPQPLTADQVVAKIREGDPLFSPNAYLGGTKDPKSFKWLIATRLGDRERIDGYLGPRFMELMQAGHHMFTGRYIAYSSPSLLKFGKLLALGAAAFDKGARAAAKRIASDVVRSPRRLASNQYLQSIGIIQPIDMMADGEQNMCDGCPDMTVHNGELVWSCRLEERLKYGCFLTAAPKSANGAG